jgi:hypothetical protein
MSPSELAAALAAIIPTRQPVFIKGQPAIGKSSIVYQAAAAIHDGSTVASAVGGFPRVPWFVPIRAVDRDPVDFRGVLYVTDGKARWTAPDLIEQLDPAGGVLCIEELPQAVPAVQCVLRETLLEHSIAGHRLPNTWSVVATGNRQEDRAGAGRLLSHVASSVIILELEPCLEDWQRWATERGIKTEIRGFLRFKPDMFHSFDPGRELNATPRGWERVSNLFDAVPDRLKQDVFSGTVGPGAAGGFIDFCAIYAKLPDPDVILANPNGATVPSEASVSWALIGAIGERCRKAPVPLCAAAATYAARMKPEYATCLIRDVMAGQPAAGNLPEIRDWVRAHPHLFGSGG